MSQLHHASIVNSPDPAFASPDAPPFARAFLLTLPTAKNITALPPHSVDSKSFVPHLPSHSASAQALRQSWSPAYEAQLCKPHHCFIQAVTAVSNRAGWGSYERLEFLGDSWLKQHVTTTLYRHHPQANEGQLTRVVHSVVSNDRLCGLALARRLHECALTVPLVSRGAAKRLFHPVLDRADPAQVATAARYEQAPVPGIPGRGDSAPTLLSAKASTGSAAESGDAPCVSAFGRSLSVKTIADVVESLIGACYLVGGDNACRAFLRWIDFPTLTYAAHTSIAVGAAKAETESAAHVYTYTTVAQADSAKSNGAASSSSSSSASASASASASSNGFFAPQHAAAASIVPPVPSAPPPSVVATAVDVDFKPDENVLHLLQLKAKAFDRLERDCLAGYKFRNRLLLLQALTHASAASTGTERPCYQRVEFLGDAVMGFLVTRYV